ncbi:MAG: lysophospholipase [Bacteroidota bacterium]|nr:lysophospholipase [Bacteroidota bacterium]
MNRFFSKKIFRIAKIILILYVAGGVTLYFIQDKLLFHPQSLAADYAYQFNVAFTQIDLDVSKEKNLSIVKFDAPDSTCRGVVLYFHGNMKNINRYARFAGNFTKQGYEVWMMDYPGFGKSTGKRTEQIIYNDALQLYKMARSRFSPDSIIIYGKSIGTGVASQLASIRDCKRLILETPFYSIDALAKHYFPIYPVTPMTKYAFPTYQYFEKITAPVTIFHGTNDEVIPFRQSLQLLKVKQNAELISIEKGKHNNLDGFLLFHHKLDSLLQL